MSERESDYLAGIINRRLTLYLRYRLPLRWREASEPGDRGGRGVERANGDERRGSYIYTYDVCAHEDSLLFRARRCFFSLFCKEGYRSERTTLVYEGFCAAVIEGSPCFCSWLFVGGGWWERQTFFYRNVMFARTPQFIGICGVLLVSSWL